jgi:hypothetical protein
MTPLSTQTTVPTLAPEPAAWTKSEIDQRRDWLYELSADNIADLERARVAAAKGDRPWLSMQPGDFPLGSMAATMDSVRRQLQDGLGFAVLRALPVERYTLDQIQAIYWGIGTHLGTGVSQYRSGAVIGHVRDIRNADPSVRVRGSLSQEDLAPHTDDVEIVGLLCVRKAREGGMSSVVSSASVCRAIARERPDLMPTLLEGYRMYRRGEGSKSSEGGLTDYRVPVFDIFENKSSSLFVPNQIEQACREGIVLTAKQREALDFMREVTTRPEYRVDFMLEPGDIFLMNNFKMYHARTEFKDHDAPESKRLMLRLWLIRSDSGHASPGYLELARKTLLSYYGPPTAPVA